MSRCDFPAAAGRLAAVLALAAALGGPARAEVDLRDPDSRHLPWRVEVTTRDSDYRVLDHGWLTPTLDVTADDGRRLRFTARNPGIVMEEPGRGRNAARWQHNLAPAYCARTPCASLEGWWDADGDGDRDLVLCATANDRSHWLVQALDTAAGEVVSTARLAAGPDRWSDGRWDGFYSVVGVTDVRTAEGRRRAYLVVAQAGFDQEPRGVLAVDTATGAVLWSHLTGAKPSPPGVVCRDLDGDGHLEVAYLGFGVDNLDGREVGGVSDDECTLLAVDDDGSRLWLRRFPDLVSGDLVAAEVDGRTVLVTALADVDSRAARLEVVDPVDGATLAVLRTARSVKGLAAVATGGGLDIYCGEAASRYQSGIARYRWQGDLTLDRRALTGDMPALLFVGDLLPSAGAEIVATSHDGRVHVLDRDLEPLATFTDTANPMPVHAVVPWSMPDDPPSLLLMRGPEEKGTVITLLPDPRPVPWGALALLPAAGGAVWYARRRRRGASPGTRRELRLQLLGRLELAGHGAIGALRSLRRLTWLLDARAQAAGATADLDARLDELTGECRDHMLPDLAGILELAGLADCDGGVVGQARSARDRVARQLEALTAGAEPDPDLREAAGLLESSLRALRREVEDEFRADLAAVCARVLAAHREAGEAAGVTVVTEGLDAPLWCRADAEELVFVVDNLVENALRAMAGSARRELNLSAARTGSDVVLRVADTGCGIAPDDWEAVMETRASAREGGGLGLPESRRRLRKYGGSLAIVASAAGAGTTFALNVAPARAQESV